jgi:hypothetical protein
MEEVEESCENMEGSARLRRVSLGVRMSIEGHGTWLHWLFLSLPKKAINVKKQ